MGFSKSKVANYKSLSYVTKPSSHQQFSSSKVRPSSHPNQNNYPRGFTDQNQTVYSPMQNESSTSMNSAKFIDWNGYQNSTWGGDENVDEKATRYIAYVRKRFLGEY
ncbi:hypothetical protein REPUB_Repub05bG0062100 [Reevesia pubescens]